MFFSPPHLEHIASVGVKTDLDLLGLNATPGYHPGCTPLLLILSFHCKNIFHVTSKLLKQNVIVFVWTI